MRCSPRSAQAGGVMRRGKRPLESLARAEHRPCGLNRVRDWGACTGTRRGATRRRRRADCPEEKMATTEAMIQLVFEEDPRLERQAESGARALRAGSDGAPLAL